MHKFGVAYRYTKDILSLINKLNKYSVKAYEIGFAYGIPNNFNPEIINFAEKLDVKISAHLPFYFSWKNPVKTQNSIKHLEKGLIFSKEFNTISVFHLGYYGDSSFNILKEKIVSGILKLLTLHDMQNFRQPVLGIETTGRKSEIGTVDEILQIIHEISVDTVIPVIDWAHLYARSGGAYPKNKNDFYETIIRLENELGLSTFYFHGGGVEYDLSGERKHLSLKTCQPPLPYLIDVMSELGYDYTMIIETPNAIDDYNWITEVSLNPKKWFNYVKESMDENIFDKQINLTKFLS